MLRPVQEHITLLEEKIHALNARAHDIYRSADERFQATVDLDIAERALAHFRDALELERKIADVNSH
jgi:hypothetical protein